MEPCNKLHFSDSKNEEFQNIIKDIRSANLWNFNTEQLVKTFLGKALCQDFFSESFAVMRDAYIETSFEEDKNEVPNVLGSFCKYILEEYYGFIQEPRSTLLESYNRAANHLAEIDNRIKVIEGKIQRISAENIPAVSQKELPVLYYYLKHNKRAKEEILTFIKEEIHDFALKKSFKGLDFYSTYPYHYDFSSETYEVKHPTMISNKFSDLMILEIQDVRDKYLNRKEEFNQFIESYIDSNNIVGSIRHSCNNEYIMDKRNVVVEEALIAYEGGSNIAFSSMCLVIIEGIFHDLCLLMGENENDILGKGFQEKVNLLYDKHGLYFHYEYYSFMFRLLRNKLAHGIAEATELSEVADLLLLDLHDVVKLSKSKRIPMNQRRYMLYSVLTTPSPQNYEYVVGAIILKDIKMPDFFNTTEVDAMVMVEIVKPEFWVYIDSMFQSNYNYEKGIATEVLKRMKKLGDKDISDKCSETLRKQSGNIVDFNMEEYLRGVFQYTYY